MKNIVDTARAAVHGDEIEETARAMVEPEPEFYTPPMPVVVARPEKRPDWARDLSSETWLVAPPAAFPGFALDPNRGAAGVGARAEQGLSFPIQSIMVDNFTAGFLYWAEVGVWVPPFNYGRVFRYNGSYKAYARFETPPGLTAVPAANVAQRARIRFFNEMLAEVSGQVLPAADR